MLHNMEDTCHRLHPGRKNTEPAKGGRKIFPEYWGFSMGREGLKGALGIDTGNILGR